MVKRRSTVKKRMRKQRRHVAKKRTSVNRKHAHFKIVLLKLKKLKAPQRVKALRMSNATFIRELCQHVRKLRHARLSPAFAKKLKRHSKVLRKLIHKKSSINVKRKLLTQRGGGILLPLIGALIPSIAAGLFGRN